MQERTASVRATVSTGGGLPSVFGDDSIFAPTATVVHGVHREHAPANQTVGEIRRRYRDRLGLDEHADAYLDGRPVGDDVRVGVATTLTFMHRAGEKGW